MNESSSSRSTSTLRHSASANTKPSLSSSTDKSPTTNHKHNNNNNNNNNNNESKRAVSFAANHREPVMIAARDKTWELAKWNREVSTLSAERARVASIFLIFNFF